jgi:hypothetical protein
MMYIFFFIKKDLRNSFNFYEDSQGTVNPHTNEHGTLPVYPMEL